MRRPFIGTQRAALAARRAARRTSIARLLDAQMHVREYARDPLKCRRHQSALGVINFLIHTTPHHLSNLFQFPFARSAASRARMLTGTPQHTHILTQTHTHTLYKRTHKLRQSTRTNASRRELPQTIYFYRICLYARYAPVRERACNASAVCLCSSVRMFVLRPVRPCAQTQSALQVL